MYIITAVYKGRRIRRVAFSDFQAFTSLDGLQLKAVPISPWKKGRKAKDGKAIHNSSGDCGDAGRIAHEELQHHPGAKRGAAEQGFYHSKRKDKPGVLQ